MAGRKKFIPTDLERAKVAALAASGIKQEIIASCVIRARPEGIDLKTLRRYFRKELDQTKLDITATAVSKLYEKIKTGHLGAICFWMKCQGGWCENSKVEHVGKGGEALGSTNDLAKLRAILMPVMVSLPPELRAKVSRELMAADGPIN